jgi:hypothetical protein
MSSPRFRVLSAYRALFRARSKVFRGDHVALRESRAEIRKHFDHNAGAETAGPNFESLLEMARDAADMLRHGIVQGTLNERTGHYGALEQKEGFLSPVTIVSVLLSLTTC